MGSLCACVCLPLASCCGAEGELWQGRCVWEGCGGLTVVGQLWVGVEVGGASVRCVCSPRDCQKLCSLLRPAGLLLWVEGTWPTRVQAARGTPAVLAVWGAPCPLGAACLQSQALLPAKAFVSLRALPRHSFRPREGEGLVNYDPSLREGKIPETSPTPHLLTCHWLPAPPWERGVMVPILK